MAHRFVIELALGAVCFLASVLMAQMTLSWFYVSFGAAGTKIIIGFVLMWIAKKFWDVAYEMQDEAWYWKRYQKTGDDFEGRYEL